jgi:hypothetical protein
MSYFFLPLSINVMIDSILGKDTCMFGNDVLSLEVV